MLLRSSYRSRLGSCRTVVSNASWSQSPERVLRGVAGECAAVFRRALESTRVFPCPKRLRRTFTSAAGSHGSNVCSSVVAKPSRSETWPHSLAKPAQLPFLAGNGNWAGFARLWGQVSDRLGFATTLLHTFEPWLPAALVNVLRSRFGQGKTRVLSSALRKTAAHSPATPRSTRSGLWDQLAFDTTVRQLPSLLRYEDRSSMAFAIETRLPFLDYRLVEFAFALPDTERLDGVITKAIARRALGDRVPRSVLERRDKMGFETPTDLWLRGRYAGELKRRLGRKGPFQD